MRIKLTETQKQHRKVRKMWIKALRSGQYIQGEGQLCSIGKGGEPDKFCCLGVLCDLAVRKGLIPTSRIEEDYRGNMNYFDEEYRLPEKIVNWVGLGTENGDYEEGDLITLNDGGNPFEDIADIIEEEPEGLFVD